jgi:hypothetical protein
MRAVRVFSQQDKVREELRVQDWEHGFHLGPDGLHDLSPVGEGSRQLPVHEFRFGECGHADLGVCPPAFQDRPEILRGTVYGIAPGIELTGCHDDVLDDEFSDTGLYDAGLDPPFVP